MYLYFITAWTIMNKNNFSIRGLNKISSVRWGALGFPLLFTEIMFVLIGNRTCKLFWPLQSSIKFWILCSINWLELRSMKEPKKFWVKNLLFHIGLPLHNMLCLFTAPIILQTSLILGHLSYWVLLGSHSWIFSFLLFVSSINCFSNWVDTWKWI